MKEELIEKALELFGTTNNCNVAGYILPNGKLLDFSNDGKVHLAGRKDHVFIQDVFEDQPDDDGLIWTHDGKEYNYDFIQKFLKETGSIRFHLNTNSTWVEMSAKNEPTFEQIETIRHCACNQGLSPHRIVYDIKTEERDVYKSGVAQSEFREVSCNSIVNKFVNELMKEYGVR